MARVPVKTTVLVIGGGPAGSYAASVLARNNIDVTILEAAKFPRYHIGESLLASTNYFLEYIGAREKVLRHGFVSKPGGAFKLRKDFPEAYTDFVDHNTGNRAVNVVRAEYDNILFRHAGTQGANIFDGHKVVSLQFSPTDSDRPIAAEWKDLDGNTGVVAFDYLVDAAGRQGMLATKYHKDRKMTESLRNMAVWAYWKNAKLYAAGTEREGAPIIESLHDHSGWCWYIPVGNNTISVGVVLHESFVKQKKAGKTLEDMYMGFFDHLDVVTRLKDGAEVVTDKNGGGPVFMASDYSYIADDIGRKNYRLVGDAACFIDPFFSSGVHLAFVGALSAALSLISVIHRRTPEDVAAEAHNAELRTAYTRFFLVVAAGYKQMRGQPGQDVNVLNDVEETSFDRAFYHIRPVIQGTGDVGVDRMNLGDTKLSEQELQRAMDFVINLFDDVSDKPRAEGFAALDSDINKSLSALGRDFVDVKGLGSVGQVLEEVREQMRQSVAFVAK